MPYTAAQIVTIACNNARTPGMTAQAGQLLNVILSELCQGWDFAVNLATTTITFTSATGGGPYTLPSDYLRMACDEVIYQVDGIPFQMVNVDLAEYDNSIQVPGISSYPKNFATDPSQSPPVLYCWPPPSGAFTTQIRYYRQQPDIATPQSSGTTPWFPNQNYLIKRLTGEICLQLANDPDRARLFLSDDDSFMGAAGILREYLKLQSDDEGRADKVHLDRRFFSRPWSRMPLSKKIDV